MLQQENLVKLQICGNHLPVAAVKLTHRIDVDANRVIRHVVL